MDLRYWWNGLHAHLFSNGATGVRLYCADGQVLYDIYEKSRQEGDPVLNKEGAAKDFFGAVIQHISRNHEIARSRPLRISEIADYYERRAKNGGHDWDILPLCFFFASVWSIDFQDPKDPSKDSDYYRTRRFAEALKWGGAANLEYETGPNYFSGGIVRLFNLLARQYGDRLFMPPEGFEYRRSHADSITLSHSIFRYGEIANIYMAFSDWGLEPNREYDTELFRKISSAYCDKFEDRCIDGQTLQTAIEQLYHGWDGAAVERRYRHYITRDAVPVAPTVQPSVTCNAYWSLIPGQFNQLRIGICLDKISGITNDITASDGQRSVSIPASAFDGISCFQWMDDGDHWTDTPGWRDLRSENRIDFTYCGTSLDSIASFNKCFDGHAVVLLQSYVPPAGGNSIWRLMVGSQGIKLWAGDNRRNDTEYAFMSPGEIRNEDVQCEGIQALNEIGNVTVGKVRYHVYRLDGNLSGELVVKGSLLFNFGISHEKIDAKEYFISERVEVRRLYSRDFVAPPRTTVFYLQNEQRIAVYCPEDTSDHQPKLYGISEQDISSCEIKPLANHRLEFSFDADSNLWITEEMDRCDIPYAVGMLVTGSDRMSFVIVDPAGEDYHASWKGYFLPKLDEDELIITGALLARGWRPVITDALRGVVHETDEDLTVAENPMSSLRALLDDVYVDDETRTKLEFIQDIGSMITTRLLNGVPNNPTMGFFRDVFRPVTGELADFIRDIPQNGRMQNLSTYFAWAIILLSIYYDRVGVQQYDFNSYMRFKRTLTDFTPNPNLPSRHYCAYFVCKGIVHAILDKVNDEDAQRIVSRGVALADNIVRSLIQ